MQPLATFRRGQSAKVFNALTPKEKKHIEDFIRFVSITSKSPKRLENNKRSLLTFRQAIGKPLDKTTLQDLRDFLAILNTSDRTQASRNELKHTIKRFLKWTFKDWSLRFDNLKDIRLVMKINEERINANTLLKKQDIEAIMKAEPKLYWKAFFMSLYESGLRPIELRTLLWKNVLLNPAGDDVTEIHIYATKTSRARTVFVKEATFYLTRLKETAKSEYVFPSVKDETKPLGKELPAVWLKRISLKVLGREVFPYMLRHSRATELYTNIGIPDKTAQKFLGHSKSMSDLYTHLSNEDVRDAVGKTIYKTQDLPEEKKHQLEIENEMIKKQIAEIREQFRDFQEKYEKLMGNFPTKTEVVLAKKISQLPEGAQERVLKRMQEKSPLCIRCGASSTYTKGSSEDDKIKVCRKCGHEEKINKN